MTTDTVKTMTLASKSGQERRPFVPPRLRLLFRSRVALGSVIILFAVTLMAIVFAPMMQEVANLQNLRLRFYPPFTLDHGWLYVLGADGLGRSMLAQLIVGARGSLMVAVAAVGLAAIVGTAIGLVSGYIGGWLDVALMRLSEVIVTVPTLLMAMAVLFVLDPSIINLIVVLTVARLPIYLRVARAQTLEIRERVFIEASRALGASSLGIMWRDVRPLVVPTIMTVAMLELASIMLAAAGLSFLGVGLQRPDVDWGTIVAEGRSYLTRAWWVTVFPGTAILITAFAANLLSNRMRATGDPMQGAASDNTERKS